MYCNMQNEVKNYYTKQLLYSGPDTKALGKPNIEAPAHMSEINQARIAHVSLGLSCTYINMLAMQTV